MLHKFIILSASVLMIMSACSKKTDRHIAIDYPTVELACDGLTITRVELTDSLTRIDFHLTCNEDCWVNLEASAHITSKGISYPMIGYEGLTPNRKVAMRGDQHELDFTLTFYPLPETATEFNFLEGRTKGCWSMIGVQLTEKSAALYAGN